MNLINASKRLLTRSTAICTTRIATASLCASSSNASQFFSFRTLPVTLVRRQPSVLDSRRLLSTAKKSSTATTTAATKRTKKDKNADDSAAATTTATTTPSPAVEKPTRKNAAGASSSSSPAKQSSGAAAAAGDNKTPTIQEANALLEDILAKEPVFLQWFVQIHVPAMAEIMGNVEDDPDFDGDAFINTAYLQWISLGKPYVDGPKIKLDEEAKQPSADTPNKSKLNIKTDNKTS